MKSPLEFAIAIVIAAAAPLALAGAPHDHAHMAAEAATASAVYKSTGSVKSVNKAAGKVTIAHEAIPDLHWPAMTMQFGVADKKLLDELAAGRKIDFQFVQRGTEYIVTALH